MGVRANVEEREKPQTRDDDPMAESTSSRFRDQENSIGRSPRTSTIHSPASARIKKRNVQHRVRVFAAVFAQYAEALKRATGVRLNEVDHSELTRHQVGTATHDHLREPQSFVSAPRVEQPWPP
jgi:hypothetical protein